MRDVIKTIYVNLPEEESPTLCRTQAVCMENGLYKLLPTPDYDPEDEMWEFPPGSVVKAEERTLRTEKGTEKILLAIKP